MTRSAGSGSLDPLLNKLQKYITLSREEVGLLREMRAQRRDFQPGEAILEKDREFEASYWMAAGWAYSYRMLDDGRRQIINFILPGDFIGFYGFLFRRAKFSVEALTKVSVTPYDPQMVLDLCQHHPRLFMAISWATTRDEFMIRERLVSLGRRSAVERVSHFLAEMQKRLELLGYASEERYAMPLTQELVADTLGLSVVHVNRTLKTLRKRGLVTIADREVHILAPERLREQAEFDTSYLRQRPASPKALARAAIDPR